MWLFDQFHQWRRSLRPRAALASQSPDTADNLITLTDITSAAATDERPRQWSELHQPSRATQDTVRTNAQKVRPNSKNSFARGFNLPRFQ